MMDDRLSIALRSFAAGELIDGKYRIEGFLGAGAMAAVFRATDIVLDRPVALKVVCEGDPELLKEEAKAMARLRHENVVQVYSYGEHQDLGFIVMELVEGGDLGQTIARQGSLPPTAAVGILEKIAAGLDAAHGQRIIHFDVKPANVLVGPRYRICVTDFGLSALANDPDTISGTPAYMSPETFFGTTSREHAPLADQYSLGVTAYEMFTGRLPFDADDFRALMRAHAEDLPPPMGVDHIPREVEAAVCRALAKAPERRFRSCGEFASALRYAWNAGGLTVASGPRILAVDDDPHMLRLLTAIVEETVPTAHVVTASDGLIALEIARATPPDLVLLDLQMPNLNGVEFLHQMRAERHLVNTGVIAISGLLGRERKMSRGVHVSVMLRALGVVDQIAKPIDPAHVAEVIRKHVVR